MTRHTYTDDAGREWQVSLELSAFEGQTRGYLIFRNNGEERRVRCRDSVWLSIEMGEIEGTRLEDTFEAQFREAR